MEENRSRAEEGEKSPLSRPGQDVVYELLKVETPVLANGIGSFAAVWAPTCLPYQQLCTGPARDLAAKLTKERFNVTVEKARGRPHGLGSLTNINRCIIESLTNPRMEEGHTTFLAHWAATNINFGDIQDEATRGAAEDAISPQLGVEVLQQHRSLVPKIQLKNNKDKCITSFL